MTHDQIVTRLDGALCDLLDQARFTEDAETAEAILIIVNDLANLRDALVVEQIAGKVPA